jgi:hypothetical protein
MGQLLDAARGRLAEYFKHREREKTRALIASWKAEGVYPYSDGTASPTEEKARQVFDICAVTVHNYVDGFENQTKSLWKMRCGTGSALDPGVARGHLIDNRCDQAVFSDQLRSYRNQDPSDLQPRDRESLYLTDRAPTTRNQS